MKVRDAMHKGVKWVDPATPISRLAQLMSEHDIGAVPIGDNDRLIGMVTDRDIVVRGLANGHDPATLTARDVMTKGIIYCLDDEELGDAARMMELQQVRRLAVINRDKRMVGILSLGDLSYACEQDQSGEVLQAVSAHH